MLGCWDAGVLGCWGAGVLGCWGAGCWGAVLCSARERYSTALRYTARYRRKELLAGGEISTIRRQEQEQPEQAKSLYLHHHLDHLDHHHHNHPFHPRRLQTRPYYLLARPPCVQHTYLLTASTGAAPLLYLCSM
ncbi:hypothetical protein F4801DRAFT_139045 [Xylaria longipes]|nr:hypothetical protein F4801DRAFT_139045 [Xylaria longipes]